jgi:hypothetical protein
MRLCERLAHFLARLSFQPGQVYQSVISCFQESTAHLLFKSIVSAWTIYQCGDLLRAYSFLVEDGYLNMDRTNKGFNLSKIIDKSPSCARLSINGDPF